jgi:hypothetical protein
MLMGKFEIIYPSAISPIRQITEALITTMKKKVKHRIDVKFEKKQNHVF